MGIDKLQEIACRLEAYLQKTGSIHLDELGGGQDGTVISIANPAGEDRRAVKVFGYEEQYRRERDVYLRLQIQNVTWIELRNSDYRFKTPELIAADDELLVIEMTVVTPPYILDFAGAWLDRKPPIFSNRRKMAEWEAGKREQFGEEHWKIARLVMAKFRSWKIYLTDVKPGNLNFGAEADE